MAIYDDDYERWQKYLSIGTDYDKSKYRRERYKRCKAVKERTDGYVNDYSIKPEHIRRARGHTMWTTEELELLLARNSDGEYTYSVDDLELVLENRTRLAIQQKRFNKENGR